MEIQVVEAKYPRTFRKDDAATLGQHLKHSHSIDIVGMRRVGISNFLRFFLSQETGMESKAGDMQKHVFILVDLNDLIERELFPFWTLTLKRIVDAVQKLPIAIDKKLRIESLFLTSIQSQDLFLVIDSIRHALVLLSQEGYAPAVFFLRFDRIKDVVTSTFLDNLQGMRDATNQQVSYVFTSYRSLEELLSPVTEKAMLKSFSHSMYLKPAQLADMKIIYEQYKHRYGLKLTQKAEDTLFSLVNGDVQYLQLGVVILSEQGEQAELDEHKLEKLFVADERISLYTEELWESLSPEEKEVVKKIVEKKQLSENEKKKGQYLWLTGMVTEQDTLFSPLFAHGVKSLGEKEVESGEEIHFSKKEQLLMDLLTEYKDQICEREVIIEKVWPEYQTFGVSDWAIDRLVARVRGKLRKQQSPLEIKTIRTRGYKLTENK